ncbi:DUF3391 domain-containing protein [Novosphingobium sp.]|uniref:HD-GYP domain-containing protein n=1 Tax=Novosphingobium sp. TaxID=1874826 RepID=UPI0033421240
MLKRIRTDQVELGMFIHRLEGNWFRHPFWKARFLLDDPARLAALHASAVEWVLIDAALGRIPDHARPSPAQTETIASAPPADRGAGAAPPGRRLAELSPEIARADRLARQAGKAVNCLFLEARLGKHIAASDVEPVIEDIYASIQRNIYAFNGLLLCQNDQVHLYRHALAVSALMIALARAMRLSPDATREAGMVGLLMDIGLAQLSADAGLADCRDLPDDQAQGHVIHGLILLRAAGDIPLAVLNACLQHHERIDGSGYPHGLAGDAIGQYARMAALCDDYATLVTGSQDYAPRDPASAIARLQAGGAAYDGALVERLTEAVGVYPIGSFVRLRSGRLAMVVDQDDGDSALPVVRIFAMLSHDPTAGPAMTPLRPTTLALGHCYGEDRIDGIVDPASLGLPPLESLRGDLMAGAIRSAVR